MIQRMGSLVLTAVLERLEEYDWDDTLFVPADATLSPDVPVEIIKLRDDQRVVDAIPGFKYLLEVGVIRDESAGHNSHRLLLKYAVQGAADEITAELQKERAFFEWYSPEFLAMSRSDPLSYSRWHDFFMRVRKEFGVIVVA